MCSDDPVIIRIGSKLWKIVDKNSTNSAIVYPLKDVIASGGEIPNFESSDDY